MTEWRLSSGKGIKVACSALRKYSSNWYVEYVLAALVREMFGYFWAIWLVSEGSL